MASSYPGGYDGLTNPVAGDSMLTVSHSENHREANDAVEAGTPLVTLGGVALQKGRAPPALSAAVP